MIRKLLCKTGLFEGVYVRNHGNTHFRLVRYNKKGERYVRYLGENQYLCEDHRTKGFWSYLEWSLEHFDKERNKSRGLLSLFRPKEVRPLVEVVEELEKKKKPPATRRTRRA